MIVRTAGTRTGGGGQSTQIYRPKNKQEMRAERQDSGIWLAILVVGLLLALSAPFIIYWLL